MRWESLAISTDSSHHITPEGLPAYEERFEEVLKFHAPGLAPVRGEAEAWHIRPDGSPAYARRFARTFGFYEGLAAVSGDGGFHHIAPDGSDAYARRHAWCGNYQGGRCAVREPDGVYRHIDLAGSPVYTDGWRYAGDYRDGVAVVQAEDGRSTHIDSSGEKVHDRWFLDLDVFHKGYARARDEDGWTHIDGAGQPVYSRRFAAVEPFYNGQARVERFDGALEIVDEAGTTQAELRPPRRSDFAELSANMVGFWQTQTIATGVRTGVFEALPGSDEDLAERCGLRLNGARRLLRALGELRLVERDGSVFRASARGALLRSDHAMTLADAALEYGGPMSRMWERLPDALRVGASWKAPDIFGEVAADKLRSEGHHRMLQSYARHDYGSVVSALGLGGHERIVDAAGGLGTLAKLLLSAHPNARITVLDRPEVIARARDASAPIAGLDFRTFDLFSPWDVRADIVLLSRVLHDWDDESAGRILAHARSALELGGRVLVIEMLIPEQGVSGALCDLHLLVATGGQERTASEYESLLKDAGFALIEIRTAAALPSVLVGEAR